MVEIVPNWHPIWVHFAIGLLGASSLFYLLSWIGKSRSWAKSLRTTAQWNLGFGVFFALVSALTGWLAASSVAHDEAAHTNIIIHRNWALLTTAIFLVTAIWLGFRMKKSSSEPSLAVTILLSLGLAALAVTGYEGGQNVYEYGIGVQQLPETEGHHHANDAHKGEASAATPDHHAPPTERAEPPHSTDETNQPSDEHEHDHTH